MAEIKIYLTLIGDDLDFAVITKSIGLQPTQVRDKNEILGNGKLFGHCEWGLETELIRTDDLSDIPDSFLSILPCEPEVLLSLAHVFQAQWNILILIRVTDSFPAVCFSPEFVKKAADIEATIGLDVYLLNGTEDG